MKKAVISGATGAIGKALIDALVQNEIEVLVLARQGGRVDRIPQHPLVSLKFCELSQLATLQNDTGKTYDVFYHFAWAGTTGAARNDTTLQNDNIRYTIDAVRAAKALGCTTFVGAGSQAEYGRVEGALTPTTPAFPENGYGIAKLCAGQLSKIEAEKLGLAHIWVRILSVYGPFDGEGSLVTSTIRKLLKGERPQFTGGEQLWDYLYSKDAAKAFVAIGKKPHHGAVYPLGGGKVQPLRTYIEAMRDAANPGFPLTFGEIPYAPLQVMHLQADISAITADTGWQPETDFADGIEETVAWAKGE